MKKINFVSRYRAFFLIAVLFSGTIFSCSESDKDLVKPKTITDVIFENEQFSILKEIIVSTKMGDALRTDELTVFAPNNAAFLSSGVSAGSITSQTPDSAMSFVKYHILGKRYEFASLKTGENKALNKGYLKILKTADSTITVNRAVIITKNINAANGVIHVVDRVLTEK
ncbi:fasciclin domain-containing protein [Dyadobacter sp. NIV53]|uniref:fasciclin domain-containing protein n=1 Tax=Dyadobacter sp. NIV53 TaxID=2861765 RepID=UPI001C88A5DD|nr:fasciclin domain-containing protein [Dyadobacter sp. NIV53]